MSSSRSDPPSSAFARERRHDGVDAAGVVADHAAERAVGVGGRIRPEGQAVLPRPRGAGRPGSSPARRGRCSSRRVDLEDAVDVLATCRARRPRCSTGRRGSCLRRARARARRNRRQSIQRLDDVSDRRAERRRRSAPAGSWRRPSSRARGSPRRTAPRRGRAGAVPPRGPERSRKKSKVSPVVPCPGPHLQRPAASCP